MRDSTGACGRASFRAEGVYARQNVRGTAISSFNFRMMEQTLIFAKIPVDGRGEFGHNPLPR
jgi:hypothetical protein